MVALLCFVQFAKASHSIEHDITAEQFHCQICSLASTDDLTEPNSLFVVTNNEFHFTIKSISFPVMIDEIDRLNTARAPPQTFL